VTCPYYRSSMRRERAPSANQKRGRSEGWGEDEARRANPQRGERKVRTVRWGSETKQTQWSATSQRAEARLARRGESSLKWGSEAKKWGESTQWERERKKFICQDNKTIKTIIWHSEKYNHGKLPEGVSTPSVLATYVNISNNIDNERKTNRGGQSKQKTNKAWLCHHIGCISKPM